MTRPIAADAKLPQSTSHRSESRSDPAIFINGKFTAQRTTGVQRVASNMVCALDKQLDASSPPIVLLCPASGEPPLLRRIEVRRLGARYLPLHAWEQLVLPMAARRGLLISLAGSAPATAARQLCTFHDAAVFDHPEAYTPFFRVWYRWLFRRLGRRAEAVITVSDFARDRLQAALALRPEKVHVIYNGGDHLGALNPEMNVLHQLGLFDRPYYLAVGSVNATKNLSVLLEAHSRLPQGSPRLVVVGAAHRGVFSARVPPAGARVIHLGAVGDAALLALYKHARALLFPSIYEGFGLPPLEAMSAGCPVIAARAAAIPEVCGPAALYFDPRDVGDVVDVIVRFQMDDDVRTQLIRAGFERVAGFRWTLAASALSSLISSFGSTE